MDRLGGLIRFSTAIEGPALTGAGFFVSGAAAHPAIRPASRLT
jgi:hypothetical protein